MSAVHEFGCKAAPVPPRPMRALAWIDKLPRLRIGAVEFRDLGEYSASVPTGTTIGKRWRRLEGSFDRDFIRAGGRPRWVIGEYTENPNPELVSIKWWRPIIVVPGWAMKARAT